MTARHLLSDSERYMIYMSYMVNKAAVPSVFSLQPVFLTMKDMKNMKKKICVNL